MSLKILIYNPGLDKKPQNINDISTETFGKITSQPILKKEQNLFSCDDTKFITNYNDIVTKKLMKYIKDKAINVCILQEVCDNNINDYNFNKYIGSYYRYDTKKFL